MKLNHFKRLLIQKALGLLFVLLSVALLIVASRTGEDCATPVVFFAPLGIGLLITNKTTFTTEE